MGAEYMALPPQATAPVAARFRSFIVAAEIEFAFVVYKANLQVIQAAKTPNHITVKMLVSSEVDDGIELNPGDVQRDFMAVSDKAPGGGAERLTQSALNVEAELFTVAAREDRTSRPGVEFGRDRDAGIFDL